MNFPITVNDLASMWSKDSEIDALEPGKESIRISKLHSKYLQIMTEHNMIVKKLEKEYAKLKCLKWEYYKGDLNNPDDLKEYGWQPWVKTVLRQDIPMYLDADKDLNNILLKRDTSKEIADACGAILKELHSRTFQLKAHITWEMFMAGN